MGGETWERPSNAVDHWEKGSNEAQGAQKKTELTKTLGSKGTGRQ